MRLSRAFRGGTQSTIFQWTLGKDVCKFENIDPVGDHFVPRRQDDGITRLMYNNVNTSTQGQGFEVNQEIDVIEEMGADIMGFSELNKPWSAENKWLYDYQLDIVFDKHAKTVYSAMPAAHDCKRQVGG